MDGGLRFAYPPYALSTPPLPHAGEGDSFALFRG